MRNTPPVLAADSSTAYNAANMSAPAIARDQTLVPLAPVRAVSSQTSGAQAGAWLDWLRAFVGTCAAALQVSADVQHLAPTKQRDFALSWLRTPPRRHF
jgi:hypothetical protein